MKKNLGKLLLIWGLLGCVASPAAAQTGRIAHFSHGGSATTLEKDAGADNFGAVPTIFIADSARLIAKNSVVFYGKWMGSYLGTKKREVTTDTVLIGKHGRWHSVKEMMEAYEDNTPKVKFLNFEYKNSNNNVRQLRHSRKVLNPASRKSSGQNQAFLKRPFQYSYWRGLAGAAALGAVGWLLGKKRAA